MKRSTSILLAVGIIASSSFAFHVASGERGHRRHELLGPVQPQGYDPGGHARPQRRFPGGLHASSGVLVRIPGIRRTTQQLVRPPWHESADGMRVHIDGHLDDCGADDCGADDCGTDDCGTDDCGTDDCGADDSGADDCGTDDCGTDDCGTDDCGTDDCCSDDCCADDCCAALPHRSVRRDFTGNTGLERFDTGMYHRDDSSGRPDAVDGRPRPQLRGTRHAAHDHPEQSERVVLPVPRSPDDVDR